VERISLYIPKKHPRDAIEKYLEGTVELTITPVSIRIASFDEKGKMRYAKCKEHGAISTVIGHAQFRWTSPSARMKCIDLQKTKRKDRMPGENRWTEIIRMTEAIKMNKQLPWPTLLHPSLHGQEGLLLIDGARRLLAYVEAGVSYFNVIVVKSHRQVENTILSPKDFINIMPIQS